MGTGRSGSTILEILVGNTPGVHQAGELTHIFRDGVLRERQCSCGRAVSSCSIWAPVLGGFHTDRNAAEQCQRLHESIETHSRFPVTLLCLNRKATLRRYRESNARLLCRLAESSGCSVVVDSSKYAGRALALSRAFPGKIYVLALSRSPAGLIRSFSKPQKDEQLPKKLAGVLLYDAWVTLCARITAYVLGHAVLRIKYEDLLNDPSTVLSLIQEWSRIDLTESRRKIASSEPLKVGHLVTANRLRRQREVKLRPAQEGALTTVTQRLVARVLRAWRFLLRW